MYEARNRSGLFFRCFYVFPNYLKGGVFMPVDFFETELARIQRRFNQTFGILEVFLIEKRYSAILNIVNLGLLKRKISSVKNKESVKEDIKEFIRARDWFNNHFDSIEKQIQERRDYANTGTDGRRIGDLRDLRQHLPDSVAQGG